MSVPTSLRLDEELDARLQKLAQRPAAARSDPRVVAKALVGQPFRRYRVGDISILARIEDDVLLVLVVEVGHRDQIYR